jgi:hypothetical protein
MGTIAIQYGFRLSKDRQEVFNLELDEEYLELVGDFSTNLPDWTRLDFRQCPNCTLDIETHPRCPAASHLADIVKRFADILSYDEVHIDVLTEERHISQDTSAQVGIGSLMGLVMATSGCPHMVFFKAMARFHLPVANDYETVYRSVSTYLLGQYFAAKAGKKADLALKGLKDIYKNVKLVNSCILDRLRSVTEKDSSLNAVITLHLFAEAVLINIAESLEEVRHLFVPYLKNM